VGGGHPPDDPLVCREPGSLDRTGRLAADGLAALSARPRIARSAAVVPLLGLLCLAAVGLTVAAADRAANAASSPISPTGAWRTALIVGVIGAGVVYLAGVAAMRRFAIPTLAALAIACVIQLLPLAGPTLLSTDVWSYWMYGRIGATLGGNPYDDPPNAYASDPAYKAMGATWHGQTTLYGPLFTLGSELDAHAAGSSKARAAWLFRLVAALSMVAVTGLAAVLARDRAFAAVLAGWNPLLAFHFAGGGHNDALMMALVLLALLLAARGRPNLAGAAWAAAIAVKWVPVVFLALWLLARWRRREPLGLMGFAAGVVVVAAAATARYGTAWLSAFSSLSGQARRTGSIGLSHWLEELGLGHRGQLAVVAIFLIVVFAALARAALRRRARLGVAGSALAFGQGWLNPWYASWGTGLAATEEDPLGYVLALALSLFLLRDILPL
jgi:hypothetical protein